MSFKFLRSGMPGLALGAVAAAALLAATGAQAAVGDTATYTFNLPSTAVASQTPPYPSVATLTLNETSLGVDFLLSPNWSSPGFSGSSFVERLDYVYKGAAAPVFTPGAGAPIDKWSYETNQNNMDASYKTVDQHLLIDWKGKNDPKRFDNAYSMSAWSFSGVLTDFTGTQADSNSKPSPIFGVISVSSYSLPGVQPTPSNWVAGSVPEPETYAMMLAGLSALGFIARRRKQA